MTHNNDDCDNSKIFADPVSMECPSVSVDWVGYIGELYEARNLVFSSGIKEARNKLIILLHHATANAVVALECRMAVVATLHALAEVLVSNSGDVSMSFALIYLALTLLPQFAPKQCTQWPLQSRDVTSAFQRLLSSIPWVMGQHATALSGVVAGRRQAMKVVVVTACAASRHRREDVRELVVENRQLYAGLHGYDLHVYGDAADLVASKVGGVNLTSANAPAYWRAYAAQRAADSQKSYDWLLWVDCDALIIEPARAVESIFGDSLGSSTASEGNEGPSFFITADEWGIRPDMWLLRLSTWGRDLLSRWVHLSRALPIAAPKKRLAAQHFLGEREALAHALLPSWALLLQGGSVVDWEVLTWPHEVRLLPIQHVLAWQSELDAHVAPEIESLTDRDSKRQPFAWSHRACMGKWLAIYGTAHEETQSEMQMHLCNQGLLGAHAIFLQRIATTIS